MKRRELFVSYLSPSNGHFLHQKCQGRARPDTLDSSFVRVSFDHLVGRREQCRRHLEAERFLAPGYKDKREALIAHGISGKSNAVWWSDHSIV
jgi:hypothetical protein